jgi:hypothetical protein
MDAKEVKVGGAGGVKGNMQNAEYYKEGPSRETPTMADM